MLTLRNLKDQTWREHAKYAGKNPLAYESQPLKGGKASNFFENLRKLDRDAEKLCEGCPVRRDCARDALENDDRGMVRGGVWVPAVQSNRRTARRARALLAEVAGVK